jgi:cytochrome c peroxidase
MSLNATMKWPIIPVSLTAMICLFVLHSSAQTPREGQCRDAEILFPNHNPGPGTLKQVSVPQPSDLNTYVRDRQVAIALGKALFWDMQVGSDGVQACASCHFRAGADPRSVNQLNPGGANNSDTTINLGVNYQLRPQDFPMHKLADPSNRQSQILRDVDDVVSSQGVKLSRFLSVQPGAIKDITTPVFDTTFNLQGLNTRRSEPRNTPTVINAAFNRRQFWDVRATNLFNGVSPFGAGDENARVLRANDPDVIEQVKVRIDNGGLASQAVGPPLSDREMGSLNRKFRDVGKRLVSARPLAQQKVARDDSVLGPYSRREDGGRGLNTTYRTLIETAFQPQWWQSNRIVSVDENDNISFVANPDRPLRSNEYIMAEYNFSFFFGLAVQLYEMTLISDDAPVDRFFDGNSQALTAQQIRGMQIFSSQTADTACSGCHSGAEFTDNSVRILFGAVVNGEKQPAEIIERMFNGNCEIVAYDQGVYNLGVRSTEEDLGIGRQDPFGNPLSWIGIMTTPPGQIASRELLTIPIPNIADPPVRINDRILTEGAFKVPSLRNVKHTAPYFHNGGQATIRQVVEFYNRGGDFREHNSRNIDFEIGKLNLTEAQIDDLVAFLTDALTDERVEKQKAPFDHPQIFVPNGHPTVAGNPLPDADGAKDEFLEVPEVGRNGGPLPKGFLQ